MNANKSTVRNVITAVIVIIVAAAIAYYWSPRTTPKTPAASFTIVSVPANATGTVVGEKYAITASYPRMSGGRYAAAFNAYASAYAQSQIADFKTAVTENDISHLPASIKDLANTFNLGFTVEGTSSDYASVLFKSETYLLGMAHPSHLLATLNVDLHSGALVALADLFRPNVDYAATLSRLSTADLLTQIQSGVYGSTPDFLAQFGGASAKAANFQAFNLSPRGLVINFQDYQVGPGAAGPAQVILPYSELSDIARPGGLLDK